jgi:drug/metabolite transporter (DMT)-like permease
LTVAIAAASSSAPLIVYAAAPALAIAFWRNALAVGLTAPVAIVRRRPELIALARRDGRRRATPCLLAGVALAAHFGTWIPSAKLTTVAAATALVSTQPVWAALIAAARGVRYPAMTWIGIGVAVLGAGLATGADIGASRSAVLGDLLAVLGGITAAIYATYGERARASITTTTYTTLCYAVCALALLVVCLVGGVRLTGYSTATWLTLGALTIGPQLLGHSLLNFALRRVSATMLSVLLLLEAPAAAALGWAWLGQTPRLASLPGLAVLLLGVLIVLLGAARASRRNGQPTNGGIAIAPEAMGTT